MFPSNKVTDRFEVESYQLEEATVEIKGDNE